MLGTARIIIPDCPHHVTQRGNNLKIVFFTDLDRQVYLEYLLDVSQRFDLRIEGYCLMTKSWFASFVWLPAAAARLEAILS